MMAAYILKTDAGLNSHRCFVEHFTLGRLDDGKIYWNYYPAMQVFPSYDDAKDYIKRSGYLHLKRLEGLSPNIEFAFLYHDSDLDDSSLPNHS